MELPLRNPRGTLFRALLFDVPNDQCYSSIFILASFNMFNLFMNQLKGMVPQLDLCPRHVEESKGVARDMFRLLLRLTV